MVLLMETLIITVIFDDEVEPGIGVELSEKLFNEVALEIRELLLDGPEVACVGIVESIQVAFVGDSEVVMESVVLPEVRGKPLDGVVVV
jgi:hypothetical protein